MLFTICRLLFETIGERDQRYDLQWSQRRYSSSDLVVKPEEAGDVVEASEAINHNDAAHAVLQYLALWIFQALHFSDEKKKSVLV